MFTVKSLPFALLVLAALLTLSACGRKPAPDAIPAQGSISGTVTTGLPGSTTSGTALHAAPRAGAAGWRGEQQSLVTWHLDEANLDFVPGELIVSFKPSIRTQAFSTLQADGMQLTLLESVPAVSAQLYGGPAGKEQTLELARQLNARDDVLYAHPNYLYHALATPNDTLYPNQWHYSAIRLPEAWNITTGSAETVVAVLDTGILHVQDDAGRSHPDFRDKVLPGYDFVSDPSSAHDGNGRDPDPFDEFLPDGSNSFHGSHVAGTIAAATNNGSGVAGIDWQARILPVRVLGSAGSGTLVDIVDGILWAAGLNVPGAPRNLNPADVINLSLGGEGVCLPFMQDALDQAAQQAIIVVAAGNVNTNAADFVPARCSSVITVGATDNAARRASYSNYGSRIDLMAPGGDLSLGAGGVLSVGGDARTGAFGYTEMQGTSMAAPHVAGVISLLKALEPDLSWQEALAILQASASPLPAPVCDNWGSGDGRVLTASDCGAGLIDAFLALQYVRDGVAPPGPELGFLQFTPTVLDFGAETEVMEFKLLNAGIRSLSWDLAEYIPAIDNPGELEDGAVNVPDGSPASGALAPGQSVTTRVGIDRSKALPGSNYQLGLVFELADGVPQVLELRFSTHSEDAPGLTGPMIVAAFLEDSIGELQPSGHMQRAGVITDFRFDALPGDNIVAAWSDENDNGEVDPGDYFGTHPHAVTVTAGGDTWGVAVPMARVIDGINLTAGDVVLISKLEQAFTEVRASGAGGTGAAGATGGTGAGESGN